MRRRRGHRDAAPEALQFAPPTTERLPDPPVDGAAGEAAGRAADPLPDPDPTTAGPGDGEVAPAGIHWSGPAEADAAVEPPTQPPTPTAEDEAPTTPRASTSGLRLGEVLIADGAVTPEQVAAALVHQRESGLRMGESLVEIGALSERRMVEALGRQLGLPVVDLRSRAPDPDAVARLPEPIARAFGVVPVGTTPDGVELAVADVVGPETRTAIEGAVGGVATFVLAPYGEIRQVINQAYVSHDEVQDYVKAFRIASSTPEVVERIPRLEVDEHAPVVQVVNLLLTQALRERASDVHIEPQEHDLRVRFRIDGVLREISTLPSTMAPALISRIKVMADMDIVERRRAQDGQIAFELDGRPIDIRVATIATIWGEKAVMRLLDAEESLRSLDELGMSPATVDAFRAHIRAPYGMIVCAGPTGSGKTTTLYAALSEINDPDRNITTIEDPVEYRLPLINQIQINELAGITFANALKAILRQDPDIILVGEVRDIETARIAVQSALTGHLVLSSLHATDAATALHRLRDMGIESFLLSSAISAVMSQRLVRRICEHCSEPYQPSVAERAFYERHRGQHAGTFVHGAGCNICSHTGYLGRIGAYELLEVNEEIRAVLVSDGSVERLHAAAVAQGMRPMRDEVLQMVDDGITTIDEAIRCVAGI